MIFTFLMMLVIYLLIGVIALVLLKLFVFDEQTFAGKASDPKIKFLTYLSILVAWPTLIIDVVNHLINGSR